MRSPVLRLLTSCNIPSLSSRHFFIRSAISPSSPPSSRPLSLRSEVIFHRCSLHDLPLSRLSITSLSRVCPSHQQRTYLFCVQHLLSFIKAIMSQVATTQPSHPHMWRPCVLLVDDGCFSGKSLGLPSEITTTLQVHRETHESSWMGFTIQVPFGANNDGDGFGICHERKSSNILPCSQLL